MIASLLAALLVTAPGAQLTDAADARRASLSDAPLSLEAMTRGQLTEELRRLDAARPSLVPPVAMLTGGSVLSAGGTAFAMVGFFLSTIRVSCVAGTDCGSLNVMGNVWLASGILAAAAGVITAIVGHVWTARTVVERNENSEAAERVRRQLEVPEAPPLPPESTPDATEP